MHATELPSFTELPPVKGMPHGCAWGLFDKDGERDQLGTLNLLTPEVVLNARKEIQTGQTVALNWSLSNVQNPSFGRKRPEHKIIDLGGLAHDDEIYINTQSGSQWDGLRHWPHQETGLYYNGLEHKLVTDPSNLNNGIHYWTQRGGIVGRAVLIDYHDWATRQGIPHPATRRTCITVDQVEQIAKEEGVEFLPGDILIMRTGWVDWYQNASAEERHAGATTGQEHIGLQGNEETVTWLWNHHFAAVAGDSVAFEAWPPKAPWMLHDFQLALWGSPIGELWDLERLSETCKKLNRWSFFFTSAPLNVEGGVGSPPNAIAVF